MTSETPTVDQSQPDAPQQSPTVEIIPPTRPVYGKNQAPSPHDPSSAVDQLVDRDPSRQAELAASPVPQHNAIAEVLFIPTDDQRKLVREYAKNGVDLQMICALIKKPNGDLLSFPVFLDAFHDEVAEEQAKMLSTVGAALFRKASKTNLDMAGVVAASLIMKTRGRWREETIVKQEITGKDGGAIEHNHTTAITNEAAQLLRDLEHSRAARGRENT